MRRFRRRLDRGEVFPAFLFLSVTSGCNLRCQGCWVVPGGSTRQLDRATLDQVAGNTGGRSYFAGNRDELNGIYSELDRIETREVKTLSHRPRRDIFHFPLLAALLLSAVSRVSLKRSPEPAGKSRGTIRVHPATGELELTP